MTDLDAMRKAPAEPRVSDENLAEQIKVHEMLGFEKTSDCKVRYDLRDTRTRADTAEREVERLKRELATAKRDGRVEGRDAAEAVEIVTRMRASQDYQVRCTMDEPMVRIPIARRDMCDEILAALANGGRGS